MLQLHKRKQTRFNFYQLPRDKSFLNRADESCDACERFHKFFTPKMRSDDLIVCLVAEKKNFFRARIGYSCRVDLQIIGEYKVGYE